MSSRVGALSGRSEPAVLVPGLRQLALRTRALAAWAGDGSRADDELLPEQMTIGSRAGGEHVPSRCRTDPQGTGTVAAGRREHPSQRWSGAVPPMGAGASAPAPCIRPANPAPARLSCLPACPGRPALLGCRPFCLPTCPGWPALLACRLSCLPAGLPRPTCPACLPTLLPADPSACRPAPAGLPCLPAGSPACRPAPAGLPCLPGRPGTLSSRSGHRARGLQLRHQVIRVVQLGTILI